MIRDRELRYGGTVILFTGISFFLLTVMRGLSTHTLVYGFVLLGNETLPITPLTSWPPRDCRMWLNVNGTVDVLILDESGYLSFLNGKEPYPLVEYSSLKGNVLIFKIPIRGQLCLLLRNRGKRAVEGEVVITLSGLESDLVFLSFSTLIAGAVLWIIGHLALRKQSSLSYGSCN